MSSLTNAIQTFWPDLRRVVKQRRSSPRTIQTGDLLRSKGIPYQEIDHSCQVSAQRLASIVHESGWIVAKPVVLKTGDGFLLAVVPAPSQVDLQKVRAELGASDVRLATEEELSRLFPDCEPGAEPPFGDPYGLPTFLDARLREKPHILFRGGTHCRSFKVATGDYLTWAHPREVRWTAWAIEQDPNQQRSTA